MTEDAGFSAWYRGEHPRLLASLVFIAGDVDLAREATDEAFARALLHWNRVHALASPGGWTYRVAVNLVKRRHRRSLVERRLLVRRGEEQPPAIPEPALELWAAVRHLPDRQRTAVVLRYVGDLAESEIATVMGVARGTVASTLATARRSLGLSLSDEEADFDLEVPYA